MPKEITGVLTDGERRLTGGRPVARRRIAVVTGDAIGREMAGPAIRALELARVLAVEHDVRLVSTVRAELPDEGFPATAATTRSQLQDVERWGDVIVFQGTLLQERPWLARTHKILVVDLYDPMHLEVLEHTRGMPKAARAHEVRASVRGVVDQMRCGDFFLCASERQWDFWIGHLAALGRINPDLEEQDPTFRSLLGVVPFGVPPAPLDPGTRKTRKGVLEALPPGPVLLWGGGLYPWLDPFTVVRAVDLVRWSVPDVRLVFPASRHPNPNVPDMPTAGQARGLSCELGLLDEHVFFLDRWVPYNERHQVLLGADVGVSAHLTHLETRYSFRTRILDYFWAGLPIVTSSGDALAEVVERHQAGFAVAPGDHAAFADALERLLRDGELHQACRTSSLALADTLRWSAVAAPLVEFCRNAEPAGDLARRRMPVVGALPRAVRSETWLGRSRGVAGRMRIHLHKEGPVKVIRRVVRRLSRYVSRAWI